MSYVGENPDGGAPSQVLVQTGSASGRRRVQRPAAPAGPPGTAGVTVTGAEILKTSTLSSSAGDPGPGTIEVGGHVQA